MKKDFIKKRKKKCYALFLWLWCVLLLAGCGKQGASAGSAPAGSASGTSGIDASDAAAGQTAYYDIYAQTQAVFDWEESGEGSPLSDPDMYLRGMQFYQGEPVQLWEKVCRDDAGNYSHSEVHLYRNDKSSEMLWQTTLHFIPKVYLDVEGNGYCWGNEHEGEGEAEKVRAILVKYLPDGEILFTREWTDGSELKDICGLPDGRVYLILGDARASRLLELDPATGQTEEVKQVRLLSMGGQMLGTGDSTLLLYTDGGILHEKEITELNMADGKENSIFSFEGSSYNPQYTYDTFEMNLWDFRALEDGSVELLYAEWDGGSAICDRLQIKEVDRIPIVIRGGLSTDGWIAGQAALFNAQSDTYHVIIEGCGLDEMGDYARLTSIQIATGGGPDILCGELLEDYLAGMLEKGALEDLSPYLEGSGIRTEDYFPFTFNLWSEEGRIYGVCPRFPGGEGTEIAAEVLGGCEPDIYTVTEALLSLEEEAVYVKNYGSRKLLEVFLGGTETLWGSVDWEQGTCDFSGELFQNILEIAKRYGDNGKGGRFPSLAQDLGMGYSDIFHFNGPAQQEERGMVTLGVFFDDGCHMAFFPFSALAVNANSAHKEGAWEFICFLLGEEAQNIYAEQGNMPASRSAFDLLMEGEKARVAGENKIIRTITMIGENGAPGESWTEVFTSKDVTEEKIEAYRKTIEEARAYPVRTLPILDIIYEEAADYFNGSKSLDEVCGIIENRVQLYLNEIH